jgi:aldehyde:ferredoxin oxidoreductase
MGSFHSAGTQWYSRPGGGWHHQKEIWNLKKFDKIKWEVFIDSFEVRKLACFNCPVSCSHVYRVTEGPYSGTIGEGVEANTIRAFGSNLDIDDPSAILKGHILCSQLGLDIDFAASTLGWAFESYQNNLININDTGGLELVWGNHNASLKLLEDIAYRRRFGKVLADGVKRASDSLGGGSEQWALHIKGADLNEAMMRCDKAWALGIAVANRGGGHLEGATLGQLLAPTINVFSSLKVRDLFGAADLGNPTSYKDKARVVFWMQKLKAAIDSLGLCYILSQWSGLDLIGADDCAELFTSVTGIEILPDDLLYKGQRLHNIEKAFNTLHAGFKREDDFPPSRFMTEPVNSGPFAGEILHEDQWNRVLDEYYSLQCWDRATGQQTEKCLIDLGLSDVARKLRTYGKLKG